MTENVVDPTLPQQSKLLGDLSKATGSLFTYGETHEPTISKAHEAESIDLAEQIGVRDGTNPGVDEHSPNKIMPAEPYVANAVEQTMELLGKDVDQAIMRSRRGEPLSYRQPEPSPTLMQRIARWFQRNAFTLLAVLAVGVVEYVIGIAWTERVFGISDDTAHIVALVLPVIFAIIGYAGAHAVMVSARHRAKTMIKASFATTALCLLAVVIGAGLVVSEIVKPPLGADVVISGGATDPTSLASDGGAYTFVKFAVYVGLVGTVTALVFLLHLLDLYREHHAQEEADAVAGSAAPTDDETARGNIAYLASFIDVYKALIETRQNVIRAYIAGVRQHLSPRIGDDWPGKTLLADRAEPDWVQELRDEIKRLTNELQDSTSPTSGPQSVQDRA